MTKTIDKGIYSGRVKNTNKRANYIADFNEGTCKRISPFTFDYFLAEVDSMTEEIVAGNFQMLKKLLTKLNFCEKIDNGNLRIISRGVTFQSTFEGITVTHKELGIRKELNSYTEIEEFVTEIKEKVKEVKKATIRKGKNTTIRARDYVKEKELLEKYRHLLE